MFKLYPLIALVGIVITIGVASLSFMAGQSFEKGQCNTRLVSEMTRFNEAYEARLGERDQCRAEVSKFNEATAQQTAELARLRDEVNRSRRRAAAEARNREAAAQQSRENLQQILEDLRVTIHETDFGPCAGQPVPAEFDRLLDSAFAAASAPVGGPIGDGVLSGAAGRD